jgi:hypothetical protein
MATRASNQANRPARRRKPGASGKGTFFHIQVRPSTDFVAFRNQDVGEPGGIERVAGRRPSGSWDTQKWLISKAQAHIENGKLVGDSSEARKVLRQLGSTPVHLGGDRFSAAPRRDIPESEKPTTAQKRAWQRNIKKAQGARRSA